MELVTAGGAGEQKSTLSGARKKTWGFIPPPKEALGSRNEKDSMVPKKANCLEGA